MLDESRQQTNLPPIVQPYFPRELYQQFRTILVPEQSVSLLQGLIQKGAL